MADLKPLLDFEVVVDFVPPKYPEWMKTDGAKVVPENVILGPMEYNLKEEVLEWIHPSQQDDDELSVTRGAVYDYLKDSGELDDCMRLGDLLGIVAKGVAVFYALFAGKRLLGWRSVIEDMKGTMFVPEILICNRRVVLTWTPLSCKMNSKDITLRFLRSS